MKKLLLALSAAMVTLIAVATAPKPLPPCKWAGLYLGVGNVTSYPKPMANYIVRTVFWVTVETNYSVTAQDYYFNGDWTGRKFNGTMNSAGAMRMTNDTKTIVAICSAKSGGVISGSFVNYELNCKGTVSAYRETLLP